MKSIFSKQFENQLKQAKVKNSIKLSIPKIISDYFKKGITPYQFLFRNYSISNHIRNFSNYEFSTFSKLLRQNISNLDYRNRLAHQLSVRDLEQLLKKISPNFKLPTFEKNNFNTSNYADVNLLYLNHKYDNTKDYSNLKDVLNSEEFFLFGNKSS